MLKSHYDHAFLRKLAHINAPFQGLTVQSLSKTENSNIIDAQRKLSNRYSTQVILAASLVPPTAL